MDRETPSDLVKKGGKQCKLLLVVVNILVLIAVVIAIIYISIHPSLSYFHHYYNFSNGTSNISSNKIKETTSNTKQCNPLPDLLCSKKVPYKFYTLPNVFGHKTAEEATSQLRKLDHIVQLKCYDLLPILLCSAFFPKCLESTKGFVPPCRAVCLKAKNRCQFFMSLYKLEWPKELDCHSFPESSDAKVCVGQKEFYEDLGSYKKCTDGILCDNGTICVPNKWKCDGIADCQDGSDEHQCQVCLQEEFMCDSNQCVSKQRVCDGKFDCSNNRDELNCYRLVGVQQKNGVGRLQAFDRDKSTWKPVCSHDFNKKKQISVCSKLGYRNLVSSQVIKTRTSPQETLNLELNEDENVLKISSPFQKSAWKKCRSSSEEIKLECDNIECGISETQVRKSSRMKRIVGGNEAAPGNWPWLVGLHGGNEEVFFCGGVLIADDWVMSTGHCVGEHNTTDGLILKMGHTRRTISSRFVQKRRVKRFIRHPDFVSNYAKLDNDLVLIQLDRPIIFNPFTRPACLPQSTVQPGVRCTMIGWGKPKEGYETDYMEAINTVEIPIISEETCQLWYSAKYYTLTDSMICAGYDEGGKDACQGDSGGPLLCQDMNRKWFVAGLASWGHGCAQPYYPGVYTNVWKFVPWIKEVMASTYIEYEISS